MLYNVLVFNKSMPYINLYKCSIICFTKEVFSAVSICIFFLFINKNTQDLLSYGKNTSKPWENYMSKMFN